MISILTGTLILNLSAMKLLKYLNKEQRHVFYFKTLKQLFHYLSFPC